MNFSLDVADVAAEDIGNLLRLEHVNLHVTDASLANTFYIVGMAPERLQPLKEKRTFASRPWPRQRYRAGGATPASTERRGKQHLAMVDGQPCFA